MLHLITSKPFSFYQFDYSTNGNSRRFSVCFPFVQSSDFFDDLTIRHAWIVRNNRKKTTTVLRENRTVITADATDRNLNRNLCTTARFTRSMNVLTTFTRFLWYDLVATPQIFNESENYSLETYCYDHISDHVTQCPPSSITRKWTVVICYRRATQLGWF